MLRKMIDQSVKKYLESLSDEKLAAIGSKILSAQGLTDQSIKSMVESVKGDRVITIYFAGGDRAIISNRSEIPVKGLGW